MIVDLVPRDAAPGTLVDCVNKLRIKGPTTPRAVNWSYLRAATCTYRVEQAASALGDTVKLSEINATFIPECEICGDERFPLSDGRLEVAITRTLH
jgi:hypothetical protein